MLALPSFSRLFVACFFLALVVASPLAISKPGESPGTIAVRPLTIENANGSNDNTAAIAKRYNNARRRWKKLLPIAVYIKDKKPASNDWALVFDKEWVSKAWKPDDEANKKLRGYSAPYYEDRYPAENLITLPNLFLRTDGKDPGPFLEKFWGVEVGKDEASFVKNVLEFSQKENLLQGSLDAFNELYAKRDQNKQTNKKE
ncbi:hypothetical protein F5879DRAFT_155703 [Lentinula edodes]|uniref:uncharacterized protein n=1 Tax=Lentinula edodes TaxID=5353 RepID=UPI001E8DC3C6|nr:uncharacterized protein C8R40DRAFT_1074692 [Lentinula edodes]KAH7868647.1 hypothetical protein C8R40DRAFT_1074692 [Lentinula edodes]KAJ3903427.1 hypothetical protein F5879DRAFT_155703 [Lentinula edodes]